MQVNFPFNKQSLDIICMSLSRWDAPISSPALSLAKELGKTNRVFFIEHPFSWKDYFNERNSEQVNARKPALLHGRNIYSRPSGFPPHLTGITPPLVYPINFLPPGKLYDYFSRVNDNLLSDVLRRVISENDVRDFIFINFFDPFYLRKLPVGIRPYCFIYHCMDDLSEVSYTRRHGVKLEEEIIRHADITLCTSTELTRLKSAFSENVHFFPNAADTDLFRRAGAEQLQRPDDLYFEGKKIIGFTGSIEYRTDFELLKSIALRHSDKVFFLIGPVSGNEATEAGLDKHPNIILAGPRKLEELPAYLRYFDCCIIPYKINTLTKSIYPLKINEYLAAGKPVVSTPFSPDIVSFSDHIEIAATHEAFAQAIDKAILGDDDEKRSRRVDAATAGSWQQRVQTFWEIVAQHCQD